MSEQPTLFPADRSLIIIDYLERYGLPNYVKSRIDALLDGRVSEDSLVCCQSGCNICLEVIYNCLQSIKKDMGIIG